MKTTEIPFEKKWISKIVLVFALLLTITACRKDDDPEPEPPAVFPVENPLSAFMASLSDTTPLTVNAASYEVGLVFTPKVKGTLNGIQVKIPTVNSTLRVTLWDTATNAIISTEIVNVTAANTVITKNISPLALVKDKQYTITMNTDSYFYYGSVGSPALTAYPLTIGNIIFNNFIYTPGTTPATYPTTISPGEYAGELNVVFQQTP